MHRRIRTFLIIGFVVLLGVRIALPFVMEWVVPRVAAKQNVYVTVGNIDLGILAGELTIEDLVVDVMREGESAESPPLLALDRGFLAFEWTGLFFDELHVADLELVHPAIRVTQLPDGSFELPVLPANDPEGLEEPEVVPGDEPGWTILLDRFDLQNPEVSLHSEAMGADVVRIGADQLGFDSLSVDDDGIGLGAIDLERPDLFVERAWILALAAGPDESERDEDSVAEVDVDVTSGEAQSDELLSIQMRQLEIKGAEFTVSTREGPVEVSIRVSLSEAGTDPGHTFPFELGLRVAEAMIGIDGQLGLNPVTFDGSVTWENLSVPPFLLLAYPDLVPWLESCNARGDLKIVYRSTAENVASGGGPARLEASGFAAIDTLSFRQPESNELAIAWESLEIQFQEAFIPLDPANGEPSRFVLSRLALDAPKIEYTNPPQAFEELLAALESESGSDESSTGPDPEEAPTNAQATPIIRIEALALTDGELRYVDRTVSPTHVTRISKLRTTLKGLATDPAPGARGIEVDGVIQGTGSFKLRGDLPEGDGELDFSLRKLDLLTYDSLARAAGVEIESGKTSLDSTIIASQGTYRTKNEIVLHDLDVALDQGNRFVDSFGMSLDVVLALLRDSAGDISLSVPVGIDADGAGIELTPIVTSAVRNAIQGAIASPAKLLGMFTSGEESDDALGAIPFAPGTSRLSGERRDGLGGLVDLVMQRPMLALSLRGHWSEADRDPTARTILAEKAESGGDFPSVEGDGFFARRRVGDALVRRARGEAADLSEEDQALLERYVEAEEVGDDRLRALAEARSQTLRSALLELGAPDAAVSVTNPAPADAPNVSIELGVRADQVAKSGA